MYTRTEQDNDITLYSWDELQAMKRRYEETVKGTFWNRPPFTYEEIMNELEDRPKRR
jgi:hypothetical protein